MGRSRRFRYTRTATETSTAVEATTITTAMARTSPGYCRPAAPCLRSVELRAAPSRRAFFKASRRRQILLIFQVLDQNGEAKDSTVIAAIQEAIALKDTFNIRVMNLSLGRPVFES